MKKALLMAALAAAVVGGQTWFAENLNYAAEGSRWL